MYILIAHLVKYPGTEKKKLNKVVEDQHVYQLRRGSTFHVISSPGFGNHIIGYTANGQQRHRGTHYDPVINSWI